MSEILPSIFNNVEIYKIHVWEKFIVERYILLEPLHFNLLLKKKKSIIWELH